MIATFAFIVFCLGPCQGKPMYSDQTHGGTYSTLAQCNEQAADAALELRARFTGMWVYECYSEDQ